MQRLYCPVKEGGVCWCCLQAFAQHKQSSWYQWHEVQWWDGLVGTATWGWGVLARLQLFLDMVFRSWRGESEGEGMEIEKRLCHIMIAAHWRSKRDGERGKKRTAIKQWVLMCGEERRRGWNQTKRGGGTNAVILCIQFENSGKLLAPHNCKPLYSQTWLKTWVFPDRVQIQTLLWIMFPWPQINLKPQINDNFALWLVWSGIYWKHSLTCPYTSGLGGADGGWWCWTSWRGEVHLEIIWIKQLNSTSNQLCV